MFSLKHLNSDYLISFSIEFPFPTVIVFYIASESRRASNGGDFSFWDSFIFAVLFVINMYGSEQNNGPYTQRSALSHEQRINKIFDKLNNIKNNIDTNRDRQINTIENRLESLFDRLE